MMRRPLTCWIACAVAGAAGVARAQIDRMNYRQWAWLEQQHRLLLADVLELPEARRRAVAEALVRNREQLPLLTAARAIAVARGIELDAGYLFRAGLQVFALPEVLTASRDLDVTIYAPFAGLTGAFSQPKKFAFELRVTNSKGEVVRRGEIAENDRFRDLMEFRTVCELETGGLPEGRYHLHVDTILDGQRPRPTDLPLGAPFAVVHDFDKRARAFRTVADNRDLADEMAKLDPLPRAILQGAAEYASRAWYGNPGVTPLHAVPDLERAERIRDNLREGRFALAGVGGFATIAVPVFAGTAEREVEDVVFVSLRLPDAGLPARGSKGWNELAHKPLVVMMPSVPLFDHADRRPSFPHFTLPDYLVAGLQLAGFDAGAEFQLAVVESPGRIKRTRAALRALFEQLPALFPFDAKRLVLVGDGYGADALADLALYGLARKGSARKDPARSTAAGRGGAGSGGLRLRGLVLANSHGSLGPAPMRQLGDLPILGIAGHSPRAKQSVALLREYAKYGGKADSVRVVDGPFGWCFTLPMAAREIESFVRKVTR